MRQEQCSQNPDTDADILVTTTQQLDRRIRDETQFDTVRDGERQRHHQSHHGDRSRFGQVAFEYLTEGAKS